MCGRLSLGPVGLRVSDGFDRDAMAPAVAEIVLIDELSNGIAENDFEQVFPFVHHIQLFQIGVRG